MSMDFPISINAVSIKLTDFFSRECIYCFTASRPCRNDNSNFTRLIRRWKWIISPGTADLSCVIQADASPRCRPVERTVLPWRPSCYSQRNHSEHWVDACWSPVDRDVSLLHWHAFLGEAIRQVTVNLSIQSWLLQTSEHTAVNNLSCDPMTHTAASTPSQIFPSTIMIIQTC